MRKDFVVSTAGFDPADVTTNGNRFLIGNGHFGYRGTLDEGGPADMVALNLAGVYDRRGDKWRESVNAYNPLYVLLKVGAAPMNPRFITPQKHVQGIDMETGVHFRDTTFLIGATAVRIRSERFAVQAEPRLLVSRYRFTLSTTADVELSSGIDSDVYDINGPHLFEMTSGTAFNAAFLTARTGECGIPVAVAEAEHGDLPAVAKPAWNDGKLVRTYAFRALAGLTYTIHRFAAVVHGVDRPEKDACALARAALRKGYRALSSENSAWWRAKWSLSDVRVRGDETAQLALRNSIYHLISIRPRDPFRSVPARGLSGQVYKGAIFWDTEMFILPFYLNTDPESARNCVMYRLHTLPGALRKARQYGYEGAFYAWESQETGDDACSDYNVSDPVTGAPIRTYFKEQQIHITGDVVYALLQYVARTNDRTVLVEGGLEMLLECAKFYLSYVRFDRRDGCYHVPAVIGPDEYHEGVTDDAFTNRLILHVLTGTRDAVRTMRTQNRPFVTKLIASGKYAGMLRRAGNVAEKLFVPGPDGRGLIEQFRGYFALEDATVADVKARVKHPHEYLGGPHGVVTPTQVIKQADVVTMLALFPDDHPDRVKRVNWRYYEPRTEHGSSLSASMYALVATAIGEAEYAYPLFLKSARIDILGEGKQYAGGIYIGGTHPAASGGAYLTAVYGFAGLRHAAGGMRIDARLPKAISGLAFKVVDGTRIATIAIHRRGGSIAWNV